MPPTVHTILTDSASVITHSLLPIGQLSEEVAEASKKNFTTTEKAYCKNYLEKNEMKMF